MGPAEARGVTAVGAFDEGVEGADVCERRRADCGWGFRDWHGCTIRRMIGTRLCCAQAVAAKIPVRTH